MKYISILAQAGDEDIITSENIDSSSQTVTYTSAQDGSQTAPDQATPPPARPSGYYNMIFLGVIMIAMYFFVLRGPKKKQQKHQQMVQSLQKNARVRTIGGIFGTVMDVKDDVITLKIDESNNTKMKVSSGAISTVISEETN
ncbi:MAG: preprotein translocase subunit YajC [Sedimentisphaerales bacterium]|nr:preprotein translocase subunit YajC [Sedimentisphaerales bacterium]